jgi:hypothetical protein
VSQLVRSELGQLVGEPTGPIGEWAYLRLDRNRRSRLWVSACRPYDEKHLSGQADLEPEYVAPVVQHRLPEGTRLEKLLCSFPHNLSEKELLQRRLDVISSMVALSSSGDPASQETRHQE